MMKFKQLLLIIIVCACSSQFTSAQSTSAQGTFGQNVWGQEILDQFLDTNELTGANLLISGPDERLMWSSGFQSGNLEQVVTPQTRFYIASTGKMLVAAAILAFVEDGVLVLDDPVWRHIQNIPGIGALESSRRVTLRQLLNHTSGLNDYLDNAFFDASDIQPSKQWSAAEAISFAYHGDVTHPLGKGFSYSNSNYVLLGHILAQLAGSLENALTQKVFSKANMLETSAGKPASPLVLARGYMGDRDVSAQAWASILGDGPVVSTVGDLEKFAFALFRDGKILGPALLSDMTTGSHADEGYGFGMGIDGDPWGDWVGHAGSYDGFEADFRYYPDDETVFVFVTNGNVQDESTVLDAVSESYFEW